MSETWPIYIAKTAHPTIKLNGTECKVELIHEIVPQLACTSLFGDWRLLWIDEADAIPPVAQVRFLTLLEFTFGG